MKTLRKQLPAAWLSTLIVVTLFISGCKKDLYVNKDLSNLPADVAGAATWYNEQIIPGTSDTSFVHKNVPQWDKTSITKNKDNSAFTAPIVTEGNINRSVTIRHSKAGYTGKVYQYDRINKDIIHVSIFTINGRLMEEGTVDINGYYTLLRTVVASDNTMSSMGEEAGISPDEMPSGVTPETPYDAPQEAVIDNGIYLEAPPTAVPASLRLIGRTNDRGNVEDLTYGTHGDIFGMNQTIVGYSTDRLFTSMYNLMAWSTLFNSNLRAAANRFIGIFESNNIPSTVIEDSRINMAVQASSEFKNFVKLFGNELQKELIENNYDINNIPLIGMGATRPIFGGYYNRFHGLTILLNDTEKTEIRLESYQLLPNNNWRAVVEVTIYDHFGLDRNDAISKAH